MRKVKRYNTDGTVIQPTQNRKTKGHAKCSCDGCKGTPIYQARVLARLPKDMIVN